nr:EOG090X0DPU [Eulimnadia texana]
MVIKYYISSLSGNKEIKKRQMKAQLIMESKGVDFEIIDISDPGREAERKFMQTNAKAKDNARYPIAPQFFNEDDYCGDYDGFDEANETDTLEDFLKLPRGNFPVKYGFPAEKMKLIFVSQVSMEKEMFSSVPAQLIKPKVNGIESENHKQDDDEHEEEEEDDKSKEEEEADEEDEVEETKEVTGDEEYVEKKTEDTRTKDEEELKNKIDDENEEEEEDDDEEEEEEETLDDLLQADDVSSIALKNPSLRLRSKTPQFKVAEKALSKAP